jgi:hypothetical protein
MSLPRVPSPVQQVLLESPSHRVTSDSIFANLVRKEQDDAKAEEILQSARKQVTKNDLYNKLKNLDDWEKKNNQEYNKCIKMGADPGNNKVFNEVLAELNSASSDSEITEVSYNNDLSYEYFYVMLKIKKKADYVAI